MPLRLLCRQMWYCSLQFHFHYGTISNDTSIKPEKRELKDLPFWPRNVTKMNEIFSHLTSNDFES